MTKEELFHKISDLIEANKVAILATSDEKGKPHMRWMNPVMLEGHDNLIYAVTSAKSPKYRILQENPEVEWILQSKSLDVIINIKGRVNLVENPSLKSHVMERVSHMLRVFWKVTDEEDDHAIVETLIEEVQLFYPMKGKYFNLDWNEG